MARHNFDVINDTFGEVKSCRHIAGAVMGALALAATVDRGLTALERRASNISSELLFAKGEGDGVTITLPGCRSDGRVIASMLKPQFSEIGDVAAITYPTKGFSLDSIRSNLLEAKRLAGDRPTSLYAISMGGIVLSRLFADKEFKNEFGQLDTIVFDSSPSGLEDIRKPVRLAMELTRSRMVSDSWIMAKIAAEAMMHKSLKNIGHEDCVSDEQVLKHFQTTAKTPLYVAREQGEFIKNTRLQPGSLEDIANNVYYLRADYDSVIDTDHALLAYAHVFNRDVQDIVDETRPSGSHAAGPEYQAKVTELLSARSSHSSLAVA